MQILENFIPETYITELEEALVSKNFTWFYKKGTSYNLDMNAYFGNTIHIDDSTQDSPQLIHVMYEYDNMNSQFFHLVKPMLYFLEQQGKKAVGIYRIKSNLMTQESTYPENFYNVAHIDSPQNLVGRNMWTLLYYVNDSDGDTILFNEQLTDPDYKHDSISVMHRVTPKRGSAILFEGNRFHASTPPRTTRARMVINYVLEFE
jgi:hypothetical protein